LLVGDLPEITPEIQSPMAQQAAASAPLMGAAGPATTGLLKRNTPNAAMGAAVASSTPAPAGLDNTQAAALNQQNQQMTAQAQKLFDAYKYGEAFNLIEQVLHNSPNDLPALVLKGQLLGTGARYPEARSTIEHILQLDPNNAMGWSMQAVVLSNLGQFQPALEAIERSLELDPQNPETYAIKNNIMASLAMSQSQAQNIQSTELRSSAPANAPTSFGRAFMTGLGLSILGIVLGLLGIALVAFVASIPYIGLFVSSIGLAILVVSAARGSFRNGFGVLLEVTIFTVIISAFLGGIFRFERVALFNQLSIRPSLFQPLLFLAAWLAVAASVPFILALLGFLIGFPFRMRRRKSKSL
jgi:Flp pilus assembly protein TadD